MQACAAQGGRGAVNKRPLGWTKRALVRSQWVSQSIATPGARMWPDQTNRCSCDPATLIFWPHVLDGELALLQLGYRWSAMLQRESGAYRPSIRSGAYGLFNLVVNVKQAELEVALFLL